jgi:hypothetical protein
VDIGRPTTVSGVYSFFLLLVFYYDRGVCSIMPITPTRPTRDSHKIFVGQYYLSGVVLLLWLVAADEAGGTAANVGLLLWHLKGIQKTTEKLVVTRKVAWNRLKIERMALTRGLERLEKAGLITTYRGRGKAIRVTIVQIRPEES